MASFRRTSSHDRPLPNGTARFAPPSANGTNTAASHCLSSSLKAAIALSDNMLSLGFLRCCPVVHKPKGKNQLWKKPFLHAIVCFFVGFVLGLTPFSWPGIAFLTHEARRELAMELKSFTTSFQRDVGAVSARERQLENVKLDVTVMTETSSSNKKAVDLSFDSTAKNQTLDLEPRKLLIIITPTYNRPFQALYLNRMAHALKLVPPPLLWLVVEMPAQTMETATILRRTGVMYRHLVCDKNLTDVKDRGVHQRNVALDHIERHQLDGIVYFADDDNVYTLELFQQMRTIKRFGTWPVGMLAQSKAKTIIEGPVCKGNNVTGWHTNEKSKRLRRFHVDMSGFAFNSTILWDPRRCRRPTADPIRQLDTVKEGFQETTFIEQLVEDESQMEGLPSGCSKVMVWHLHLEAPELIYPPGWVLKDPLNPTILFN